MADDCLDRPGLNLPGPPVDLGVSEPVERKARLPLLFSSAAQGVAIRRCGLAKRPDAQLARLEDLRVSKRDRLSGRAANADPEPTNEVLTEIENRRAGCGAEDVNRLDHLCPAHRRSG